MYVYIYIYIYILFEELPWPDGSFDVGVSSDVLEHIPEKDVARGAAEISRLVRHVLVLRIAEFLELNSNGEQLGLGNLHVTVRPSDWWQRQFAPHGWRLLADLPEIRPKERSVNASSYIFQKKICLTISVHMNM